MFYLCSIDALWYGQPLPLLFGIGTVCWGGAVFGVLAIAQAFIFPWLDKSTVQLIVLLEVLPIVAMWLLFQFYCFRTVFQPVFRIAFPEAVRAIDMAIERHEKQSRCTTQLPNSRATAFELRVTASELASQWDGRFSS